MHWWSPKITSSLVGWAALFWRLKQKESIVCGSSWTCRPDGRIRCAHQSSFWGRKFVKRLLVVSCPLVVCAIFRPLAFGLCSLFLFTMKLFSFVPINYIYIYIPKGNIKWKRIEYLCHLKNNFLVKFSPNLFSFQESIHTVLSTCHCFSRNSFYALKMGIRHRKM